MSMEEKLMVYNEKIDARIHPIMMKWKHIEKRKMFGGVCYLYQGNMFCGVYKDYLILKLGEENAKKALELPFAKPFDITGRPMKGWIMVGIEGIKKDDELYQWLTKAKDFIKTLPAK
jgi:hypothetical protein